MSGQQGKKAQKVQGSQKPLVNAEEIIKSFGGIRPMATKMDVPVTTVQGWKKRGVIPANRRAGVIAAARKNSIDLSGLVAGAKAGAKESSASKNEEEFSDIVVQASADETKESEQRHIKAIRQAEERMKDVPREGLGSSSEREQLMLHIKEAENKAVKKSVWFTMFLVIAVAGLAAVLLWPSGKEVSGRITALEGDVRQVKKEQSFLGKMIPDNIEERIATLQDQALVLQDKVSDIGERADIIAGQVLSEDAGPLSQRLQVLEGQVEDIAGSSSGLAALLERIRSMESSLEGQAVLGQSLSDLQGLVLGMQGEMKELDTTLEGAQREEDALGETLEGISSTDLKAAAMLLALTKFRQSLNRSAPFEEDLELMQKLLGEDNPELQGAISRLSPRAKEGVLSTEGLDMEFRSLAGEILVSSLKGEDVSVQEKAKARLHDILQVEKDGEMITGTDTQVTVARAQKMLDEGDVQGAIVELRALEGPAAQTAQPWIEEAELSLMARKLQDMLQSNVMGSIGSMPTGSGLSGGDKIDIKKITSEIGGMTGQKKELIYDEESGFGVLVP